MARRVAGDLRVAERFEVYACGVELANGFGELTNAGEQRRRFGLEVPIIENWFDAGRFQPPAPGQREASRRALGLGLDPAGVIRLHPADGR